MINKNTMIKDALEKRYGKEELIQLQESEYKGMFLNEKDILAALKKRYNYPECEVSKKLILLYVILSGLFVFIGLSENGFSRIISIIFGLMILLGAFGEVRTVKKENEYREEILKLENVRVETLKIQNIRFPEVPILSTEILLENGEVLWVEEVIADWFEGKDTVQVIYVEGFKYPIGYRYKDRWAEVSDPPPF